MQCPFFLASRISNEKPSDIKIVFLPIDKVFVSCCFHDSLCLYFSQVLHDVFQHESLDLFYLEYSQILDSVVFVFWQIWDTFGSYFNTFSTLFSYFSTVRTLMLQTIDLFFFVLVSQVPVALFISFFSLFFSLFSLSDF